MTELRPYDHADSDDTLMLVIMQIEHHALHEMILHEK